jgi:ribose transport system permease protein
MTRKPLLLLLHTAPVVLFLIVVAAFALAGGGSFLIPQNVTNILEQSSATGIVAIGMTFVLLTAGVDLSVGSVMFGAVAVRGKLIFHDQPIWLAFSAAAGVGLVAGAVNAIAITRFRIVAFVVTLAMLFVGRGFGLWLTNTRAMNMPDVVTQVGAAKVLGVPAPVLAFAAICLVAQIVLTRTTFGRQVYAVGNDPETARKAGIRVGAILVAVYVICGLCAAVSGLVSLTQTGAVSPTFGDKKEFIAIAAAVLGGTSLFGGRGSVFPGTVLGAVLMQTVENGLVIVHADPYTFPLVTSAIIFVAVLVDSLRARYLAKLGRRLIRPMGGVAGT